MGPSALAARLVQATAANVAHPFDDVMVGVVELRLEHLQVAHLEARGRERHLTGRVEVRSQGLKRRHGGDTGDTKGSRGGMVATRGQGVHTKNRPVELLQGSFPRVVLVSGAKFASLFHLTHFITERKNWTNFVKHQGCYHRYHVGHQ